MHRKNLGDVGEKLAAQALTASGFTGVRDLNEIRPNHPGGDIYAERDGTSYFISVKARKKYQRDGKLNRSYNLYPQKVVRAAQDYGAIPAWLTVQIDVESRRYHTYFGTIDELQNPSGIAVPMTPLAVQAYECLNAGDLDAELASLNAGVGSTSPSNESRLNLQPAVSELDGAEPLIAEELGFTPGTKTHRAVAMYLRPQGATTAEVTAANGGPYLNCLKRVAALGHQIERDKVSGRGNRKTTCYRIVISEIEEHVGDSQHLRDSLTKPMRLALQEFIEQTVRNDLYRSKSFRMEGVPSGAIFNLLKQAHPSLAKEVATRSGLVSVAADLGFTIRSYVGGGKGGVTNWETIDYA